MWRLGEHNHAQHPRAPIEHCSRRAVRAPVCTPIRIRVPLPTPMSACERTSRNPMPALTYTATTTAICEARNISVAHGPTKVGGCVRHQRCLARGQPQRDPFCPAQTKRRPAFQLNGAYWRGPLGKYDPQS